MLSIFSTGKPFLGHTGVIQRNAIISWTKLVPRPDVFLFGEEEGSAEIAQELGLTHLRDIRRNRFGTPLLDDVIKRAKAVTSTPLLCYSNCDIILLQEFQEALSAVHKRFAQFLGVAYRWEIDLPEPLKFPTDRRLDIQSLPAGNAGHHTAIDVFVFTRDLYAEVPALALGRAWFDQWLIKDAILRGIPVVDLSKVAKAIHQKHDYGHISGGQRGAYDGEEAQENLAIYGGAPHAYTLLSATHEIFPNYTIRKVRYRREKFELQQWIWRNFVQPTASFRGYLGLSRSARNKLAQGRK
jgi:hypothetical protein